MKPFLPACALFSAYARTDAEMSLLSFCRLLLKSTKKATH